ncbi:hypothetical protein L1887_02737 [Cichorium endivia]|nr:hypothetical protein L1887_02737 [Cichorium endivia]
MNLNDPGTGEWVMDTGATDHVHSNSDILDSLCNNYFPRSIYVGNGSAIPVVTSGHSTLPISNIYRPLHLQNVLITPNIIKNLIYVRKCTTHNNCSIDFDPYGFTILDYQTRRPLIRCDSSGPLYPVTRSTSHVFVTTSPFNLASTARSPRRSSPKAAFF